MSALLLIAILPIRNAVAVGNTTIAKPLAAVVVLLWLGSAIQRRHIHLATRLHLVYLLFFSWASMTMLWSVSIPDARVGWVQLCGFVVVAVAIYDLVETRQHILLAMVGLLVSGWLAALTTTADAFLTAATRATAPSLSATRTGGFIALAAVIATYLLLNPVTTARRSWTRTAVQLLAASYLFLGPFAALLTGSRIAVGVDRPCVHLLGGRRTADCESPRVRGRESAGLAANGAGRPRW